MYWEYSVPAMTLYFTAHCDGSYQSVVWLYLCCAGRDNGLLCSEAVTCWLQTRKVHAHTTVNVILLCLGTVLS